MLRPSFLSLSKALSSLGFACLAATAAAGTATNISGLFFTGDQAGSETNLAAQGGTDGNWKVTYASTNGGSSENTSYVGSAYVITNSIIQSSDYVQNTGSAQWITAPDASTNQNGTSLNTGGDYLPGNGTSGSNAGFYMYTLAFQISGAGTGTVTNDVAISLTIAADDDYYVFVNPTTSSGGTDTGTSIPNSNYSASGTAAWTNTTSISLANYTDTANGYTNNATFVVGTNYLEIGVINSNNISGTSSQTTLNPSGLLVYQVGNVGFVNGKPVPEMHTWMPLALVAIAGCLLLWRRKSAPFGAAKSGI